MIVLSQKVREKVLTGLLPVTESGCWLWTGFCESNGYGRIRCGNGQRILTHRASWEIHVGHIPDGMQVLHKCDTPLCGNPDHLFLGTQLDNMRDRNKKGRAPDFRGDNAPNKKLSVADAERIRSDGRSQRVIAKEYGVSQTAIGHVKLGKTWKVIPCDRNGKFKGIPA